MINSSMTVGEFVYLKFCAFIVFFIAFESESYVCFSFSKREKYFQSSI